MSEKPTYEELEERLKHLERQVAEQQEVRKSLEESNIHMLDILESISDGFFSLDENLIVSYFNGAAEVLLGDKAGRFWGGMCLNPFPSSRGPYSKRNS